MSQAEIQTTKAEFDPLGVQNAALAWKAGALVLGMVFLAVSSRLSVPLYPVPVTMQTFAVTMIGALYGWRLGAATIVVWLALGAAGMPVLAPGAVGLAKFMGPTAGYLLAFPFVGAFVGWLASRGWSGKNVGLAFAAMLIGNALCLVLGAAWLAAGIGATKAVAVGVVPFIIGGVLKSALGAALLKSLDTYVVKRG